MVDVSGYELTSPRVTGVSMRNHKFTDAALCMLGLARCLH